MKIAVLGKSGQLAFELSNLPYENSENLVFLGREDIDVTNKFSFLKTLDDISPDAVINAAGYTNVDKAESDRKACEALNYTVVEWIASYCRDKNIFLVHVSTDYVFDGKNSIPYKVSEKTQPLGYYGETKALAESAVRKLLPHNSCIIRTSWLYSEAGDNFVLRMLNLMCERDELSIIDDQIGSPTWAKSLAESCMFAVKNKVIGLHHWTDEGVASWYDFAAAIQELGIAKGLLKKSIQIKPIPSSQYPTRAKRPHYSVLDKTLTREAFTFSDGLHWRAQLSAMMDNLK